MKVPFSLAVNLTLIMTIICVDCHIIKNELCSLIIAWVLFQTVEQNQAN